MRGLGDLSARYEFVQFGLFFGIAPEAIRAEIDLVPLVIDPKNVMAVFFKLYFEEVLRLLQPFEDPTLRDNGSEIHDALIAVGEDEL
jgi:hypothetical protein